MMLEMMEIKKHYGKSVSVFQVLKREAVLPERVKTKTMDDYKKELGILETEEQKKAHRDMMDAVELTEKKVDEANQEANKMGADLRSVEAKHHRMLKEYSDARNAIDMAADRTAK